MLLLLALCVIVLFLLGAPIFAVMIGLAAVGSLALPREFSAEFNGTMAEIARMGTGESAQVLATIPLFIFAGYIMAESKTADRLVRVAQAGLGWLPGGLAVVTILACAIFTTFTGASGVTIVALGGLLMPSLIQERYPERFATGLVAGTGSVGLLFPPALPLFVYGTVFGLQESLAKSSSGFETDRFLFAGVVPGAVLIGILAGVAIVVAIIRRVPRRPFSPAAFAMAMVGSYAERDGNGRIVKLGTALPEIIIPFLVIFLIANGVAIPEVAAMTVVYVAVLEIGIYRDLPLTRLWRLIRESMGLAGAIFIIIFAAAAFTNYLVTAEVPQEMVEWISAHVESKWAFLLALNVLLIAVGMIMDIFSAIVVVVPLIAPMARQFGIDPYHLGVIFLLNLEIGYLTPPVGLNLFITAYKFQKPVAEVIRATLPFLLAMIVALGLVTYIPALTVVPPAKRTGRLDNLLVLVQEGRRSLDYVQEVTLPDGKVKRFDDCRALSAFERNNCETLFADVTQCRRDAGGMANSDCERDVIATFLSDQSIEFDLDTELEKKPELDPALQEMLDEDNQGQDGELDPELRKLLDETEGETEPTPAAPEDELDPELQKLLDEVAE